MLEFGVNETAEGWQVVRHLPGNVTLPLCLFYKTGHILDGRDQAEKDAAGYCSRRNRIEKELRFLARRLKHE